ncbi:hypothetical protein FBULB1_558 [Fusarium bulbicola]|nr:hypothetical protein FBULB1_558 [Fusarium bulbicola]
MALPPKYNKALGALELLLVNQVKYLTILLEEVLPFVPGMQKHWVLDASHSSSEGVGSLRRTTPQNTQESLTYDPLDWCLMQLQGRRENPLSFDHAMLFAMVQDHLSHNQPEGKRLDEITYRTLSDLEICHQMLTAVQSHQPRNATRTVDDVLATEDRNSWKLRQALAFGLDTVIFTRIGKPFISDFYQAQPPTGPKNADWISKSQAIQKAMETFWGSVREFLRKDLTKRDFTREEADSYLDVISAHLSEEYIQSEQDTEAEILATIHTADKPHPVTVTFNEGSEPSLASTKTPQGLEKIKTRGEPGPSATDITEPQPEDTEEATKDTVITLPKDSLGVIHLMFPSKNDAGKGVTWSRFVTMMSKAGFAASESGGSAVSFEQVSGEGGRVIFHKPHPDNKIDPVTLRIMGKRMTKWFGWKRELFALPDEKAAGVQQ